MKRKIYELRIQETNNSNLLLELITRFLEVIKELCTVELITIERKR